MTPDDAVLFQQLRALEVELHQPAVRGDAARLEALLHHDFVEFGRSGSTHTKANILSGLPAEAQHATVVADHFELRRLAEDVALVSYRSSHRLADGSLDRFTLRTSVWQRTGLGWQMRLHQGTPTAPYAEEPRDGSGE